MKSKIVKKTTPESGMKYEFGKVLFYKPQLPLVYLVDILPIYDLDCRNTFVAGRAVNVSSFL